MTMIANGTPVETRGRKVKFTPEVIEQVKQWVAEGVNRVEIAKRVGSSVGSLQVTCSRLGIRLRRKTAFALSQVRRVKRSPSLATYSINGHPLLLTREDEINLAIEATMRGIGIGDLLQQIAIAAIEKNLVTEIMDGEKDGVS